jgi:hypothetical protein
MKTSLRNGFLIMLILLAVFSRLIPHPHNFTPIGGIALFGAAYFSSRWIALLIPLLSMWLSDLVINNTVYSAYYDSFQWFGSIWVYAAFLPIALLGMYTLQRISVFRVAGAAFGASVIFFLLTNFGVWMGSIAYPQTLAGLLACYAAGIPFFGNTLLGDLVYSGMLFGVFVWASSKRPVLAQ